MRRLERGFLTEFCEYSTDGTEVPSIFALWSGLSCLSMALGRKCSMNMGHFHIYPNMYIVLIGESARCRKSTAIGIAARLIKKIHPPVNVLSQKQTPEALIQALMETPQLLEGTILTERAEGIAIVSELSTMIDKNSFQNGMIPLLTDLWDSPDEFVYRTRGRGKEIMTNCYLSILGGSTAQWIKEAVPIVSIGGGFTSRIIFVYVERPEKSVPFPEMSVENRKRGELLVEELNTIAMLNGHFHLSPNAKLLFEKNYGEFNQQSEMVNDKNLAGYAGRRHTNLLKLGMLISASERDTKQISEQDLQIGIKMLESVEESLPRVMDAITSETVGDICEEVLKFIQKKQIVRRSVVMSKFASRLTSRELAIIIDTLMEMKVVTQDGPPEKPMLVSTDRKRITI